MTNENFSKVLIRKRLNFMKILVETIFLKTKASEWTSNKYKPLIFIYKTNRGGWQRVVTHNDWVRGDGDDETWEFFFGNRVQKLRMSIPEQLPLL